MSTETEKETNEQLVQKIKAGEDVTGNMGKLWQQNRNFVYLIARKYAKTETDIDDLMQEGYLGMYRAIEPYDLSTGVAFLSYASFWIRQGMQRYSQDNKHLHIPYNLQEKVLRYQRFLNTYRMRFGKNPGYVCHLYGNQVTRLKARGLYRGRNRYGQRNHTA